MRNIKRIECPICKHTYSLCALIRHLRRKHINEYSKLEILFGLADKTLCNICDKTYVECKTINDFILKYFGFPFKKNNCECKHMKKGHIPWNKGLTKETNSSLKKISENRMGDKNPIHKVLNDPVLKEKWLTSLNSDEVKMKSFAVKNKGKTLEEIHRCRKGTENKKQTINIGCKICQNFSQ